jgi:hypothetical protein
VIGTEKTEKERRRPGPPRTIEDPTSASFILPKKDEVLLRRYASRLGISFSHLVRLALRHDVERAEGLFAESPAFVRPQAGKTPAR